LYAIAEEIVAVCRSSNGLVVVKLIAIVLAVIESKGHNFIVAKFVTLFIVLLPRQFELFQVCRRHVVEPISEVRPVLFSEPVQLCSVHFPEPIEHILLQFIDLGRIQILEAIQGCLIEQQHPIKRAFREHPVEITPLGFAILIIPIG